MLLGFSYDQDKHSLKLTFSNKNKRNDSNSVVGNALKNATIASKTVDYKRTECDAGVDGANWVKTFRENALDASVQNIIAAQGKNKINLDENGFVTSNKDDESKPVYITYGEIVVTENGLQTARTAVNGNGVIADTLCGKILLGN